MSSQGLPTLELDVRTRRTERRVAALAIALAAGAPWLMDPDFGIAVLALSVAGAILSWAGFRRAGWIGGSRRIGRVSWQADGQWLLVDARGKEFEAVLRPDTRVAAGFIWLRWNAEGVRSMLLTKGDVPVGQLRRLGLRLRLDGSGSFRRTPRAPAMTHDMTAP
jgi:hypothetical protein